MVLTIIGHPVSTCTRRVKTALYEKGVEFNLQVIDWPGGEHRTEAHLQKQPFGQVPVLIEEDGFILYESRAISRYIAAKYANQGTKLLPDPSDLKAVALFEQAASVELADFDPPASGLAYEKIIKPRTGLTTDEKRVQTLNETLKSKLDGYERILSKHKYLAGEELTLVDLFHLPYAATTELLAPELYESHPKVHAWYKELKERPSWKKANEGL
ncbi:hypothetical protein FRB90_003357 [Tulasnella sp. 427]|nr:hypothetical protein FRB90_003357 [Tulasnella sp. 427]